LKNPDDANTLTSFIKNQFLLPVQTAALLADAAAQIILTGIVGNGLKIPPFGFFDYL